VGGRSCRGSRLGALTLVLGDDVGIVGARAAAPTAASRVSVSSRYTEPAKYPNWSARNAFHSEPGSVSPAATTARHPRPVPAGRFFGSVANGIP
jgi:hypothetical protein